MRRARDWLLVPFLVVVSAAGIGWGGRATYRTVRNLAPAPRSCADVLADPSGADWVRLDGCVAASDRIGIETSQRANEPEGRLRDAVAVYIPLRAAGKRTGDRRVALLLRVDHGPMLRLGARYESDEDAAAAAEVLAQPIEGMIERSLDRSQRDREKLRGLGLDLADDFLIIDYGARPRPLWLGLGVLGVGLGALALLVRKWRRRARPVALAKAKLVAG